GAGLGDPVDETARATGRGIALGERDVGAAGIRDVGRLEIVRRLEAGRQAAGGRGHGGRGCKTAEIDRTRGVTPKSEGLAMLLDLVLRDSQRLCREPNALRA